MDSELLFAAAGISEPILTIAIPTFRRAKYLCDALDSIFSQKRFNDYSVEIIVVNNDPEDDMSEPISAYADKPIRFYRNRENYGQVGNVNRCIELANGKFVAFLHDDDLLMPEYLEVIFPYLMDTRFDCLIPSYYQFFENYRFKYKSSLLRAVSCARRLFRKPLQELTINECCRAFRDIFNAPTCGVVFNKKTLLDFGLFRDERGAAWDFYNYRLLSRQHRILMLHKFLGARRMYSGMSNTAKVQAEFDEDLKRFLQETDHPFLLKYRDCIDTHKPLVKYLWFRIRIELYYYFKNLDGFRSIPYRRYRWLKKQYDI